MNASQSNTLVDVLGIHIAPIDIEGAVAHVARALENETKGYVCMAAVHSIMEAHRDPSLKRVYAGSILTAPDGMPTVWIGRLHGHSAMRRVAGPDLMLEVFSRPEFGHCTHFLYGGKGGVATELRHAFQSRYPAAKIVGTYTPPFRELTLEEESDFVDLIGELRPDIIWVGIGAPRQDRFMHRMLPRLETRLMFGVGAAFDFHTGRIHDCADWIKQAGLQWVDRLIQDPKHLWKRCLRNNPAFLWHALLQLTGLKTYSSRSVEEGPTFATTVAAPEPTLQKVRGRC